MRARGSVWLSIGFLLAAGIAIGCNNGAEISDIPTDRTPPPPTPTPTNGRHHPDGFSDPAQHGPYSKFVSEDCRGCHGQLLDGVGALPATLTLAPQGCNSHHAGATPDAWQTNCTFCHGGQDNQTGAPSRDITELAGQTTPNPIFKVHSVHVVANADHVAYDCIQCHAAKPDSALSPGHWIVNDTTPGFAEVAFVNGLNAGGVFGGPGTGTCTSSYCHGTGRAPANNGSVTHSAGAMTCHSCHGYTDNAASMGTMSARHRSSDHRVACYTCHSATVDVNGKIVNGAAMHINKTRDVLFAGNAAGMTYTGGKCNGSCHGQGHNNRTW